MIAYFLQPWSKDPVTPKSILDALKGDAPTPDLDDVLGLKDPMTDLDAALAVQAGRR